jgi:hypothetical protein
MSTTPTTITEAAIQRVAEAKIAGTCAQHGINRDQLKAEVVSDAYTYAKEKLTAEAERAANPYFQQLEQEREKSRLLAMQLEAVKASRVNVGNDTAPAVTADMARARLGQLEWNHKLDDNGRLQAIGVDPSTVTAATRAEIMELFGPQSSSARASDLMKANGRRYRSLKEIGKALRII